MTERMQDITEMQRRLAGALDRIGTGLEALGPIKARQGGPETEQLAADLDAERQRADALEERLRAAETEGPSRDAAIRADLDRARASLAEMEEDRARLKALTESLRTTCEKLREVNTRGVGDADLVNRAMTAEIDALRTMRDSDRSELDAILRLLDQITEPGEAHQDA